MQDFFHSTLYFIALIARQPVGPSLTYSANTTDVQTLCKKGCGNDVTENSFSILLLGATRGGGQKTVIWHNSYRCLTVFVNFGTNIIQEFQNEDTVTSALSATAKANVPWSLSYPGMIVISNLTSRQHVTWHGSWQLNLFEQCSCSNSLRVVF